MLTFLAYLLGLVVVAGALFLVASFAFGRGEQLAPMPPDGSPVELPDERPVAGDDVRGLRLPVVLRGYRMGDVDWVLDQLAAQLDERDRQIARLRGGPDGPEGEPPGSDGRVDPVTGRPDPAEAYPQSRAEAWPGPYRPPGGGRIGAGARPDAPPPPVSGAGDQRRLPPGWDEGTPPGGPGG